MTAMGWLIVYIIGFLITAAIQAKCGKSPIENPTYAQQQEFEMGRAFTILFWPIFLPIFAIMWITSR